MRLLFSVAAIAIATAVAAEASDDAAKRYHKLINDRIGRSWYSAAKAHSEEITPGGLHVLFDVSPQGKLLHLRVTSNTSNQFFATLCADIIRQTKFPPTPPTLGKNGVCFFDLKFTMYDH
jgi:hypothetical protein